MSEIQHPYDHPANLLSRLIQGSIIPDLRAVTLRTPIVDGNKRIYIRFIVDTPAGETVKEVFEDVLVELISGTPSSISDDFDHYIVHIPEPNIIKMQRDESIIFRRWEPGVLKLLGSDNDIRMPKVAPPTRTEIAGVIANLLEGDITVLQAAAWARYWSWTIPRPSDYPVTLWELLEYVATIDRFTDPRSHKVDYYWIPDHVEKHLQQAVNRLRDGRI